ncbi:MAG: hypothetical protein HUJ51_02320, partial [Eggerthellaceae bacterium]|nr:hypothetical protein [Eggerthellaceae bacterium]
MPVSQGFFPKHNIVVICGHYGVGKTNLCLNLAREFSLPGRKNSSVTLIDLDLVNPYFRSSEYQDFCKLNGIELVAPILANTTVDIPSISGRIETLVKEHLDSDGDNLLI